MTAYDSRIWCVTFPTPYICGSTMMRFQEHYECPNDLFRGKVFSREKYEDWYAKENDNKFTYSEDWSGFNFPSSNLKPFINGKFDPLTSKEKMFLHLLASRVDLSSTFYVIACCKDDIGTMAHEIVHGLFGLNHHYRGLVSDHIDDTLFRRPDLKWMSQRLRDQGYDDSVLLDELNAYLVTSPRELFKGCSWSELSSWFTHGKRLTSELHNMIKTNFGITISDLNSKAFVDSYINVVDFAEGM